MKQAVLSALKAILTGTPVFRLAAIYLLGLIGAALVAFFFLATYPNASNGIILVFAVLAIALAITVPLLIWAMRADQGD